jgi:hypothetical protein
MPRLLRAMLCMLSFGAVALAQERKIEISPFAGGYFSSGFQESEISFPGFLSVTGFLVTPNFSRTPSTGEPNSGIFGVRGSHQLPRSLALEGTFGFSPTGQRFREAAEFTFVEDCLSGGVCPALATGTGETYQYAGNLLYELSNRGGWVPFFTAGAGAVTRTDSRPTLTFTPVLDFLDPNDGTLTFRIAPSEAQTNLSVNLGGGMKKYLSDRYGIRFDFRSYISQPRGDTVNNMELSFGLIFRL